MQITKENLRKIIKEELESLMNEQEGVSRIEGSIDVTKTQGLEMEKGETQVTMPYGTLENNLGQKAKLPSVFTGNVEKLLVGMALAISIAQDQKQMNKLGLKPYPFGKGIEIFDNQDILKKAPALSKYHPSKVAKALCDYVKQNDPNFECTPEAIEEGF